MPNQFVDVSRCAIVCVAVILLGGDVRSAKRGRPEIRWLLLCGTIFHGVEQKYNSKGRCRAQSLLVRLSSETSFDI